MKIYKKESDEHEENLFGDCERVLETLSSERVFGIYYDESKKSFVMYEECDQFYGVELTAEICRDLSVLFAEIGNKINQNKR